MVDKPDGSLQALVMVICLMWPVVIPMIVLGLLLVIAIGWKCGAIIINAIKTLTKRVFWDE
jgi:hypothetical protein